MLCFGHITVTAAKSETLGKDLKAIKYEEPKPKSSENGYSEFSWCTHWASKSNIVGSIPIVVKHFLSLPSLHRFRVTLAKNH